MVSPDGVGASSLNYKKGHGDGFVKGDEVVHFTLDKDESVSYNPKANDDQNKKNPHIPNAQYMQTKTASS